MKHVEKVSNIEIKKKCVLFNAVLQLDHLDSQGQGQYHVMYIPHSQNIYKIKSLNGR